jgi:pheromone shutdown protein TraB
VYATTVETPVLLVGTAHVIDLAAPLRATLSGRDLQGIAVELDPERAQALLRPPPEGGRAAGEVPFQLRLWALLQRRLGEDLGAGAGDEMRTAAKLATEWGLPLFLIDDPIRETLARLLGSLSFRERVRLLLGGVLGLFLPSRVIEDQIGEYTRAPGAFLEEMRTEYPGVTRVLLDDRNEHMAERLRDLRAKGFLRVAAIVGDAHLPGLAHSLRARGIPVEEVPFATLRGAGSATAPSVGSAAPG